MIRSDSRITGVLSDRDAWANSRNRTVENLITYFVVFVL